MRRSYKYRLKPNTNQLRELSTMLETHRRLYNECLEWRRFAWDVYRVGFTFNEQRDWFIRTWRNHPHYSRLNSNGAHETIARLDKAFQAFFRRVKAGQKPGYPRFKGKDHFNSIPFSTYPNGLKLAGDRIKVQHIGSIKVVLHRPIPADAKIKTATLKREGDRWFVVFSLEQPDPVVVPSTNLPIGIDVGIKAFLATSDGELVENPKHLAASLPALRRAGRAVSRKKKGGANRRKAVKQLRKVHNRTRDLRKDHHHKVANDLIRRYGSIGVERLNIRGMLRNPRLARSIADAGWGSFIGTLRYKAEGAGVAVVEVDPRGTSQECSECGATVAKGLSVRTHDCPSCGLSLDRDVNAARNVFRRAFTPARIGPAGLNVGHQAERAPGSAHPPRIQASARKGRQKARPAKGSMKTAAQVQLAFGFTQGPCEPIRDG